MTDLVKVKVQLPHGFDPNLGPGWTDVWIREGTSDEDVLKEVWVMDTYHLRGLDLRRCSGVGTENFERIIDVGACTGLFTALCAQAWPRAEIAAIEPDRENIDLLTLNTGKWRGRVHVIAAAVGAHAGEATLYGGHGTGYTLDGPDDRLGQTVRQVTLAELLLEPVSLLKMDIEGGEYEAIAACPPALLASVDRIVMEWHGTSEAPWVDDAPARYGELLTHLAYTHSVTVYGRPDAGGYLYAHRNDL